MSLPFAFMVFFYWLFLSGAVFIAGAFTSRILVTVPSGAELCVPGADRRCLGESASRIVFWIALCTLITDAAHAIMHASVMTDTPLNEVMSIMVDFLTKTKYGRFTLIRTVMVMLLVLVSIVSAKKNWRVIDAFGALFSLALLVTISMSGHKGVEGYMNLPFATDALHAISVSLWIGGVFYLFMCFSFLMREVGAELWGTLKATMNRFSNFATVCVTVAVLSGVALSFFSVKSYDQLTQTPYGLTLIAKILLAGIIITMGAANKFYVVPRINSADINDPEDLSYIRGRLTAFVAVEAYVGVGVLLATAVLTHLSPEG